LPGNFSCTASANSFASPRSGVEVSNQTRSAYGAYARPREIGGFDAVADPEEAFRRALAGHELAVVLVDVAREESGGERVRARDEHGRHAAHVRSETRGVERPDELLRRDEHLAAEVAALLLRRQLVLVVDARRPPASIIASSARRR
jgi:hypothetical protein